MGVQGGCIATARESPRWEHICHWEVRAATLVAYIVTTYPCNYHNTRLDICCNDENKVSSWFECCSHLLCDLSTYHIKQPELPSTIPICIPVVSSLSFCLQKNQLPQVDSIPVFTNTWKSLASLYLLPIHVCLEHSSQPAA